MQPPSLHPISIITACLLASCGGPSDSPEPRAAVWTLAELPAGPPCELTVSGAPEIVDSPLGKAVRFDGEDDGFFLACNPLDGLAEFTVEAVFLPESGGPAEQRFLHFGHPHGDRVLLETRVTADGQWYLDSYFHRAGSGKPLIDPKLLHPAGRWYHVAYVVREGRLSNYVNGRLDLSTPFETAAISGGATSIGVRLNREYWFQGSIRSIRVSPEALPPPRFTGIPE